MSSVLFRVLLLFYSPIASLAFSINETSDSCIVTSGGMATNIEEKTSWGSGGLLGGRNFRILGSLMIMLLSPPFAILTWYTNTKMNGSLVELHGDMFSQGYQSFMFGGWFSFFVRIWPSATDGKAWQLILSFMLFELILMRIVPGKIFRGVATATGHIPHYIENGVQCYLITVVSLFALAYAEVFNPAVVYDKFGEIISAMNVFSLCFCSMLSVKGLFFPSTKDCGSSGDIISDMFWGTELYPRILGWDLKEFTNCRFGMMYWQVGILCYAFKQYSDIGYVSATMFVSVLLQSVYIFKFFWWETGYFCSMDIQHDRAGFMLCWGCMVWVPSIYTLHTFWWTKHPIDLSLPYTLLVVTLGLFFVWLNYDCDRLII